MKKPDDTTPKETPAIPPSREIVAAKMQYEITKAAAKGVAELLSSDAFELSEWQNTGRAALDQAGEVLPLIVQYLLIGLMARETGTNPRELDPEKARTFMRGIAGDGHWEARGLAFILFAAVLQDKVFFSRFGRAMREKPKPLFTPMQAQLKANWEQWTVFDEAKRLVPWDGVPSLKFWQDEAVCSLMSRGGNLSLTAYRSMRDRMGLKPAPEKEKTVVSCTVSRDPETGKHFGVLVDIKGRKFRFPIG